MAEQLSKTFFVLITFISTFGILLSFTPTEFLAPYYDADFYIQRYPDDTWVGREINAWDETFLGVDNDTLRHDKIAWLNISNILEDDIELHVVWFDDFEDTEDWIYIRHNYPIITIFGLPVIWDSDYLYNLDGDTTFSQSWVSANIEEGTFDPEVSRFELTCDHFNYYFSVTYNETKFDSLWDAYLGTGGYDPELYVFVGMGFESEWASLPTWLIIAQLLTFQAPNVHPVINGLIAIPLWIAIVYLAYHLVLRMIPFVGD